MDTLDTASLDIDRTTGIVAAYVTRNHVAAADLPALIASVHAAVAGLGRPQAPAEPEVERPSPSEIRKSIRPDGLVSFLDGKPYKTLKRHLSSHGLTPEGYRARYGLPADYPMTAPDYSAVRSALAKANALGVPGGRAERPALAAVA